MNNTAFRNALSYRSQHVPNEELIVEDWRATTLFSTRLDMLGDISSWIPHQTLVEVVQPELHRQWVDEVMFQRAQARRPFEGNNLPLDRSLFLWKRRYFTFPRDLYPHMNPKVGVCLTQRPGAREPRIGLFALQPLEEREFVGFCTGEWALENSIDSALGDLNRCTSYYQNTFGTMVQSTVEKKVDDGRASKPGVNCSTAPKELHNLGVVPRFSSQAHASRTGVLYRQARVRLEQLLKDEQMARSAPTLHATQVRQARRALEALDRSDVMHRGLCIPYASEQQAADLGLLCYATYEELRGKEYVADERANCETKSMLVRPADDPLVAEKATARGASEAQYGRSWEARLHASLGLWTTVTVPRGYELIGCCASHPSVNEAALMGANEPWTPDPVDETLEDETFEDSGWQGEEMELDVGPDDALAPLTKLFDARKNWAKLHTVATHSVDQMRAGFAAAAQMAAWNSNLAPGAGLVRRAHCGPPLYVALCKSKGLEGSADVAGAVRAALQMNPQLLPGAALVGLPSNATGAAYLEGLSYAVMQAEARGRPERAAVFAAYDAHMAAADAANRGLLEFYTRIVLGNLSLAQLLDHQLLREWQFNAALGAWARAQAFPEEVALAADAAQPVLAGTPLERRRDELLGVAPAY